MAALDVMQMATARLDGEEMRKTSSTPVVVTGTAPALAKAGVGGYIGKKQSLIDVECKVM